MYTLRTAYALHFSEGIPKRMLLTTQVIPREPGEKTFTMSVIQVECDWTWQELPETRREYIRTIPKGNWLKSGMGLFHRKFRKEMFNTYNWRFEIYHPFSDTL